MDNSQFQVEHKVYKANLEKWLTEGLASQYVVIKGQEIIGIFKNPDEAFKKGIELFGENNFFMSSIVPSDSTNISFYGLAV